jgi:hypothetical protein
MYLFFCNFGETNKSMNHSDKRMKSPSHILFPLLALALGMFPMCLHAQQAPIDRQAVVARHCPHVTAIDSLQSLTVGNGSFAFTVDATGLQTFPEHYAHGVCLGTFSGWGWHSFPNTQGYRQEEILVSRDFGRGHKELYAAQFKQKGRQQDAANYLRMNPHRLHLGTLGLDLKDPALMSHIDERLDLWTGEVTSHFDYQRQHFDVHTVADPKGDLVATRVSSKGKFALTLRFAYPTGAHSDDACDWTQDSRHSTDMQQRGNGVLFTRTVDSTHYNVWLCWRGNAKLKRTGRNSFQLACNGGKLEVVALFAPSLNDRSSLATPDYSTWQAASAQSWKDYWTHGGFIDLGNVSDPRAKELERRIIQSQYLMAVQESGQQPPQETGLTYNSWFGKFHLEMTWWHLAHYALWQRPQLLMKPLEWYFSARPAAEAIARRQGFKGLRWMKMTDPWAGEAPSNVGSYLIWQQPHLIYLAELLYRALDSDPLHPSAGKPNADQQKVLDHYAPLVDETAEWMADFAQWDSVGQRYVLRGCIPAQETLKADSTVNPPFELNYWHTALGMAQQWRMRRGLQPREDWQRIIDSLSPLAFNADSLYLAAESATNTYTYQRYTSDHPAMLGALGVLPMSKLVDKRVMKKTIDWVWRNWNWPTSWGWDFPMTAMTCARLGEPLRAVDALLMSVQKNTYLPQGHNYQDQRLRVYMPGNGGLLAAVAMMAAGWDGSVGRCPGFPADWDVRYENLSPMP